MTKKKPTIEELRKQQKVTKGMEWFRLEEEIQELLEEEKLKKKGKTSGS